MTEESIKAALEQADRVLARKPDVVDVIEYKLAGTGAAPLPGTSAIKDTPAMTITERINAVVDAREAASLASERKLAAFNEWQNQNMELYASEAALKLVCQEAEDALREEAIKVYKETKDKKVAPGVGIRVNTRLEYDPERALGWAVNHNIALKLDTKAFEQLARINPIPFVNISEEPIATLSANLEKVGE